MGNGETKEELDKAKENLVIAHNNLKEAQKEIYDKRIKLKELENSQIQKAPFSYYNYYTYPSITEQMRLENERKKLQDEINILQKEIMQKQYYFDLKKQKLWIIEMKKEQNERDIKILMSSQNITLFSELIERFYNYNDSDYLVKTLEALDEDTIIKKYEKLKGQIEEKIKYIYDSVYGYYLVSLDCKKKLVIILLAKVI